MMSEEIGLTFDCGGSTLVGIVHRPECPGKRGVLAVVAGGPQYRAGVGRQLVYMGRALSGNGIPVMRFDYRGMGDSSGSFLDFECIEDDLRAALDAFRKAVPEVNEVILWGGCNAASAIMMNAWKYSVVSGMVLASPYIHAEETQVAAVRRHYWKRLQEKSFWVKLFQMGFNLKTAKSFLQDMMPAKSAQKSTLAVAEGKKREVRPFQELMLEGMEKFKGRVLLVMSGRSLDAIEFEDVISRSARWRSVFGCGSIERIDLPEADQTFSSSQSRDGLIRAVGDWLHNWH